MLVLFGIILLVLGALVTFAIDAAVDGVDLVAVGYILMGAGVLALAAAAVKGAGLLSMGDTHGDHRAPSGGDRVVEVTDVD